MNAITWCILVSLNQLNGSAGHRIFVTSHPNMKEYLENIQPEKADYELWNPSEQIFCKILKGSRIFKAADPEAPNFKLLGTEWESLLNFSDPSLVDQKNPKLQYLNEDLKKEVAKLENDRYFNRQILCFKSATYEYYLVLNSDTNNYSDRRFRPRNVPHYDRLLLLHHLGSKESAVLALIQIHSCGRFRCTQEADEESGIILEEDYLSTIKQGVKTDHEYLQPSEDLYCKILKESRIFKAADPEAPNFKLLGTEWESLLNFSDPSLVEQENPTLQRINEDLKKEVAKLENDRYFNRQTLCFKSATYEYYLVLNLDTNNYSERRFRPRNITHYDRLLFVRHMESKELAVLALVQIHSCGRFRRSQEDDEESGIILEKDYVSTINEGINSSSYLKFIAEDTFCSMTKYHLLNYCSRVLNLYWDWIVKDYKRAPSMANSSLVNSVDISNYKCIFGKLKLPTQPQKVKNAAFLPCTVKQGELTTQFHLTPAGGIFMANNTDGENYTLRGHIYPVSVLVKKSGL